jgi:hypothetical protein
VTVTVDAATTVTLTVTGGAVRSADAARCSCLLAPNCLHRVAVLARAPVDDGTGEPAPDDAAVPGPHRTPGGAPGPRPGDPGRAETAGTPAAGAPAADPAGPERAAPTGVTARQREAAEHLWRAAVAVLGAGLTGSGAVLRAGLVRAAYEARVHGLHRAAAAGTRVATQLQAAREGRPQHRLGELADDLRELLGVANRLRYAALPAGAAGPLLGSARRAYDSEGALRLYGLCCVPVVADTGYAGVVSYLVDRSGEVWAVADLMPGEAPRAAGAAQAMVALGEAGLTHRQLAGAGLVVSGATASATRQLGAGKAVRAARAGGAGWTDEPLAALWREPLAAQLGRAFDAAELTPQDRTAGSDLVYLRVRVIGPDEGRVLASTVDGTVVALAAAEEYPALPFRENLLVLARAPGLELLVIGRPDPRRRATVAALAVAPVRGGLALPESWCAQVSLGYDRLHVSQLRPIEPDGAAPAPPDGPAAPVPGAAGIGAVSADPALGLLRRHLERVVSGGRAVEALAPSPRPRLAAARLPTGARLLDELSTAARSRQRDTYGRLVADAGDAFAVAWLAAAVYERAASRAVSEAAWGPPERAATQPAPGR